MYNQAYELMTEHRAWAQTRIWKTNVNQNIIKTR